MKYLFFSLFSLFALTSNAQTNQLNEVQKLIKSFKAEKNLDALTQAKDLITELITKDNNAQSPVLQLTRANVLTLAAEHLESDEPIKDCDKIIDAFSSALVNDSDMKNRPQILLDLYDSKINMMNKGNKVYEESDYDMAHQYYKKTLELNELEMEYPRVMPRDTSLLFTSGVFANLAGKSDEAIQVFEELVDMEYARPDMYNYLEKLYTEKGQEEKAKNIIALREKRYPSK